MSTLNNIKKKMGRPMVDSEAVTVRCQRDLLTKVDAWIESDGGQMTRPQAIRKLVEFALTSKK